MSLHSRTAAALAMLLTSLVASCGSGDSPARPDKPVVASFVHDIPQGHPRLPYFDEFVETVRKRSDNRLDLRVNPGNEVLAGRASLDAVHSGKANIAAVNMAHLEAMEPAAGFMNLPFGLNDTIMADNRKRAATVGTLADLVRPHGVELLGLMRGADQLFAFPSNDIRRLQDLRSMRIRVAGGGIYEQMIRALGAEPVPIPIPQLKEAMAAGKVDGVFTSPGGWSNEILQDAPHAVQARGLMFITYGLVANSEWLASLSERDRSAITEAGARMTGHWERMQQDDRNVVENAVADGGTYFVVPDSERPRWKKKVAAISARFLREHQDLAGRLEQEGVIVR